MPIIKVLGMPPDVDKTELVKLIGWIQEAVLKVPVLNIPAKEVFVFFPPDLVTEDLGEELIAEIGGLFERPERTAKVLDDLRHAVCVPMAIFAQRHLPQCKTVEAYITSIIKPSELALYEKKPEGAFLPVQLE